MNKYILGFFLALIIFFVPQSADAANWKAYTIVDDLDGFPDQMLVTDGVYDYILKISTTYGGGYYSFTSLDEGQVLLIDVALYPAYGDDVYYDPPYGSPVLLTVSNFPDQLNLYSLYVVDDDWLSNRAIVQSGSQQYIVDYSSGCFSLPEGQYISIDSLSGYMSVFADLYDFTGSYSYETCSILDYSIVPSVVAPPATASPTTVSDSTTNTVTTRESISVEPKKVQKLGIKTEKKKRTLSWKKASGAKKYTVEVYKKSGKKWVKVSTKKTSKTKESYSSLKKGNYKFRVKGLNGSVSGDWSAWKIFSVK